jgi:hypothetical protein
MLHTLPPVFSPDNSPPMGVTSRTAYLPLISPAPNEEGKPFNFDVPRRGSTPSLAKSSASQYFEELRKRRRTSETSMTAASNIASNTQPAFVHGKESRTTGRFAELPTSIAQSIMRAMESQANSSSSFLLKKRTMSMPNTQADEDYIDHRDDKRQRRASMRSQQLALLASQARLARTGATSVETARRAERAVEGAVRQVVKEAQAGVSNMTISRESSDDTTSPQTDSKEVSPTDSIGEKQSTTVEIPNGAFAWSDALANPHRATAFLSSASAVAHDWANGFYKFEEEWAEDALKKERRRMSEHQVGDKRQVDQIDLEAAPSPKKTVSAPSTREASPAAENEDVDAPQSVRSSLVAAHKRLSASLPSVPTSSSSKAKSTESGGQLVDVLSNFASLIGQRKEVCQGLEKLAQDAKSLSNVPLPSIATALSQHPTIEEEEDHDDYVYERNSAE